MLDNNYISNIITKSSQKVRREFIKKNKFDETNMRTVIYTRVSTRKQTDNTSLEGQLRECYKIAEQYGYQIIDTFGESFESAKSFINRKEFEKVIKFVQDKKNNIAFILFYDFDRFARDIEAITLSRELKDKYKVRIISAKNPKPPVNEFDFIQQDQQHISNYAENVKRTDKIVNGCINKLREGYWLTKAPIGYTKQKRGKNIICVPDINAKYVKEIYYLRAERRMEIPDIFKVVSDKGFKIKEKYCYRVLENPFYCGLIAHGLLEEGELVKGVHEPLVTEETWLKVNDPAYSRQMRKLESEYSDLALKGFLKCDECGRNLTGYYLAKKDKYYYKCGTKGCRLNISSVLITDRFKQLLDNICIPEAIKEQVKKELNNLMADAEKEKKDRYERLVRNVDGLETKLKNTKIRYATGEIDQELFNIAKESITDELELLRPQLWESEQQLSNFSENIEEGMQLLENLSAVWGSANVEGKKRVQKAVISSALVFDRKKRDYRTDGLNTFIRMSTVNSRVWENHENENSQLLTGNSASVVSTGIEPVSKV